MWFTATWLPFSSVPDCLYGSVEFGTLSVCVCVCVCAHAGDSGGNESSCHRRATVSRGNARPAKGSVTCLSVSADLFRLQASRSIRHVVSSACCLRASCHKPPVRNVDSGHNTLHSVGGDQSARLSAPRASFCFPSLGNYLITYKSKLTANNKALLVEY